MQGRASCCSMNHRRWVRPAGGTQVRRGKAIRNTRFSRRCGRRACTCAVPRRAGPSPPVCGPPGSRRRGPVPRVCVRGMRRRRLGRGRPHHQRQARDCVPPPWGGPSCTGPPPGTKSHPRYARRRPPQRRPSRSVRRPPSGRPARSRARAAYRLASALPAPASVPRCAASACLPVS